MPDFEIPEEDKELLAASMAVLSEYADDMDSLTEEIASAESNADDPYTLPGELVLAMYNTISILVDSAVASGLIDEEAMQERMAQYLDGSAGNITLH